MGESLIDKELRREVIATFGDPAYRPPPLPSVAIQLVGISQKDDVELREIVRLLEQDQVLAGIVMRLVSSPLYSARTPVTSLEQAVVRIGLKKLCSIVFEGALRGPMFVLPGYRELAEQVSRHGTTAAYITRLVCEACGLDAENGFLCGLLHDVGFSALLLSVTRGDAGSPPLSAVWRNVDDLHEQASGIVARLWGLPPQIAAVVGHHHHPERCTDESAAKLAAAACVADALTEHFGASIADAHIAAGEDAGADRTSAATLDSARGLLGLDDTKLGQVLVRAEEIVTAILWV